MVCRLSCHGLLGLEIPYLEVKFSLASCVKGVHYNKILTSICDLGDLGEEEQSCQEKDKDDNRQVNPLYVLESLLVAEVEEDVRAKNGGNDGTDSVESLGDVDSELRILWWAADWGNIKLAGVEKTGRGRFKD